jgi:probable rRNA maturation factor
MTIDISRSSDISELSDAMIQQLFAAAAQTVPFPETLEWSVAFVDDTAIEQLNEQYRHKTGPTDVLSFRYDDEHGEIVISSQRVLAQAEEYGNTVLEEAAWMVVHGILHVLGWDHERSPEEYAEQRALEIKILSLCSYRSAR